MNEPRKPLSQALIAVTAVRLIDEAEEDGFSMRSLARALNVDPMAIYRHLPNKDAVVRAAIDIVIGSCVLPAVSMPWQDRLRAICRAYRGLAVAHPGVFPLLCTRAGFVPNDYPILDACLSALSEAGLSPEDTVRAASTFLGYAQGFALEELTGTLRPLSDSEEREIRSLSATDYPSIASLVDTLADADLDGEFEFGLAIMVAGIEQRVSEK
ncbi:TetR/AcrR family transcriptional regulator [Algihabitans albus]|uniref:TetR/AcrR family transcriptional regulator C-terminal domain-containing protein n=1 Tax=Algihabitans albus TaxID=2164067 RepID=UPI0035CFF4C7